jgi:hypothetical protein
MYDNTAEQAGWELPQQKFAQGVLFGNEPETILAEAALSWEEVQQWQELGWLSFDFAATEMLDDAQRAEIFFLRDLTRSCLPTEVVMPLLAKLPRPYAYSSQLVAYSFRYGWVQLPRPASLDEMLEQFLPDWLDAQIEDGNLEQLEGLRDYFAEAVETIRAANPNIAS